MAKEEIALFRLNKTIVRIDKIVTDNEKPIRSAIEAFRLAMDNANLFFAKRFRPGQLSPAMLQVLCEILKDTYTVLADREEMK